MIGPQTAREAIRRAREYIEGVDTSRAIRASLAMLLCVTLIVGIAAGTLLNKAEDFEGAEPDWNTQTSSSSVFSTSTNNTAQSVSGNESAAITSGSTNDNFVSEAFIFPQYGSVPDRDAGNVFSFEWYFRGKMSEDKMITHASVTLLNNTGDDSATNDGNETHLIRYNHNLSQNVGLDGTLVTDRQVVGDYPSGLPSADSGACNDGTHSTSCSYDTWYLYNLTIDYNDDEVRLYINDTLIEEADLTGEIDDPGDTNLVLYARQSTNEFSSNERRVDLWWDDVVTANETYESISGDVESPDGTGIEGALVTAEGPNETVQTITDSNGHYLVNLDESGDYTVTAEHDEWTTESINVTVDDDEAVRFADITLFSKTELFIDTDTQLCQGETADYTIFNILSDKPGAERNDVTDNATFSSENPSILTINETSQQIEATSDPSIGKAVTLTAEHDNSSETKDVFVGELTVDNVQEMENSLDMLVGLWGNTACRDGADPPGGTQLTMLWIFASLSAAIVVTRFSTTFGGIGAFAVVMTMGWFISGVGEGMIVLTWAFGVFLGLNVATNFQSFKR